ncbi:hypothetical protein BKA64DRAFT_693819 [Cadophora sp. MPI-SDFR-AT-0126]|nr:hypothetical protein BKA64DRAFT_693819 [Leotiomycetes sp. MPI-SDFR-AT-0126]
MADGQPNYTSSKEGMENEDRSISKPGSKRREVASRAGTRSVASLTPEQLARKRANDREAQRSIRQRTKTHIQELEQRIRDLSQDQDVRDLEQIKRRNTELEEELRQLRELLGRSESSVASSPELTPLSCKSMIMNVNGMRQPTPPTSHPLTLKQNKPRMDSTIPPQQNGTAYEMPGPMSNGASRPAWELSLQFLPPTGPVDSILIGLLQRQRNIATQGTPSSLLIGPYHPDFRGLVNPEVTNNIHPVASIICNLFQRIEYTGFAEKAAALFLVYHFVQWQILPTMETYRNIPDWFRPRPSQLVTLHPFWTSLAIWGKLRDVIIGDQEKYATEEFMTLYQHCISVNWPFRDEDILMFVGEDVRVTDAFVRHIETQANWSLSESFQRRYPELRDVCRFAEVSAPLMSNGN